MLNVMWVIGINQTSSVIFALPPSKGGYGLNIRSIGFLYFAPIIATLIGEFLGHWGNDVSTNQQKHIGGLPGFAFWHILPLIQLLCR